MKSLTSVTDCRNKNIEIKNVPLRIISLVPSLTEMLFDLGVGNSVIGGTRYCISPEIKHENFTIIGGTKKVNYELIMSLNPDFIIANKEENTLEMIDNLEKICPVYVSYLTRVTDHFKLFADVGKIINKSELTDQLSVRLNEYLTQLQSTGFTRRTYAYFIWKNPFMIAGHETYISDLLSYFGLTNCDANKPDRYPEIDLETLNAVNPGIIFLSSEPFPFSENDCDEWSDNFPKSKVIFIDGSMTSWYGTRIFKSIPYLTNLISKHF